MSRYQPATQPTFYFIGGDDGEELDHAGLPRLGASPRPEGRGPERYRFFRFMPIRRPTREAVSFIKSTRCRSGALVTTHKIDLFNAAT